MIQPQELRIGNLVFDHLGRVQMVSETRSDAYICYLSNGAKLKYKLNTTQPIPLTEEILLNFGFEKIKSDEYPHKYVINKYMRDEVEIENLNSQNCFVFSHGKKFSSIEIEYVHQLQNLYFSLTGKELTFKN